MNFKNWILFEGMITPETLPDNVSLRVTSSGADKIFKLSDTRQEIGRLKLRKIADDLWCPHNKAQKGYGPLLYDIAIEYSTLFGRGALPATGTAAIYGEQYYNTDLSNVVWKYYFENRHDVSHKLHPKTPKYGFLNPIPVSEKSPKEYPWLFCVYTKPPISITKLQDAKKIVFQ